MDKKPNSKNKLQLIDEILNSNEDKNLSISVSDFKSLFTTAQLNRGWTKPQLETILERLNNG